MIDPGTGLLGFRIGLFVVLLSFGCLFIVEPGSAAFYADVITLILGLVFIGVLAVLIRKKP
jgi:hypothetical protein